MLRISDLETLKSINKEFISHFISQNSEAHNKIIHTDFVCINGNGTITERGEYIKNWSHAFDNSNYQTFSYSDEFIRIFKNFAIVRAKTHYTKLIGGEIQEGETIYSDTYIKEKGKWLCIQAQITLIKK